MVTNRQIWINTFAKLRLSLSRAMDARRLTPCRRRATKYGWVNRRTGKSHQAQNWNIYLQRQQHLLKMLSVHTYRCASGTQLWTKPLVHGGNWLRMGKRWNIKIPVSGKLPPGKPAAPPEILQMIRCWCSSDQSCGSGRCGCHRGNLACTMFCAFYAEHNCCNHMTNYTDEELHESDDEGSEEFWNHCWPL